MVSRLSLLLFLCGLSVISPLSASERPPNLIFFLADDLGWTGLSSFGSDLYETPNLDRLAAEGMKFTNAYAACTVCSPTRAAFLTGMYPARLRLTSFIPGQDRPFARMNIPDWTKGLRDEETTLPEVLRSRGYKTLHIGKWHLEFPDLRAGGPTSHGFEFSQDKPKGAKGFFLSPEAAESMGSDHPYLTDSLADLAARKIKDNAEDPFFLYFAFHVPHTPIQGREDLVSYFEGKVDPAAIQRNPTFAAMVKSMDLAVGTVVDALEENGLTDNTAIVFTSDNGGLTQRYGRHDEFTENIPLRRGKGSAYEGGVRVPAIVKWPGHTKEGTISETPVATIDWMPTLLEIAGAPLDEEIVVDGVSLVPLLQDEASFPERDLFWHFPHYHAGGDGPYSAIRSANWKLIERHETGSVELYDLPNDLSEGENLAEKNSEKAQALKEKLHAWRKEISAQMPTENPDFDSERAEEVKKKKR